MPLHDLALFGVKWEILPESTLAKVEGGKLKAEINNNHRPPLTDSFQPSALRSPSAKPMGIVPPIPVADANDIADGAKKSAESATDAMGLCAAIQTFAHPLAAFANAVMPQLGNRIIIVTDIPSADDDANGKIMTGAAGDLLDKMLASVGISRESISIVPLVFWRTPGGRTPLAEELALARPFVLRAIELGMNSGKCIILTLGALAASEIAGAKLPADHGKIIPNSSFLIPHSVIPIWHPNTLMVKPDAKRAVWDALQKLRNFLQNAEK